MDQTKPQQDRKFTPYQVFIIAILAILQFTVIVDFMVLSPLGAVLLTELNINTGQFGLVVSAYAFSAGASGFLAAGFADKFDRKKLLLFFYTGFLIGTLLCALAPSYHLLLIARIVTGIFGGVISSIGFAIITDLFRLEFRGRVMGFVQMAFAASQILGIPIGLWLANRWGWHSPFFMIVGFGLIVGVVIVIYMKPITAHLAAGRRENALQHLWKTISNTQYLRAFLTTVLLATGGFMLMPFSSAYSTNNLKIALTDLPLIYFITGIFAIVAGPLIGRLSDKVGKYKVFFAGSIVSMIMVFIFTNLGPTPLWEIIVINVILFISINMRIIPASALLTAMPEPQDRGAFMSVNSSIQQVSGGVAAAMAGLIVVQREDGFLEHYNWLGYVVIASMLIVMALMYMLNGMVNRKALKDG